MKPFAKRLLCAFMLVAGIHAGAFAAPECPSSEKAAGADQERVRDVFPGSMSVSPTSRKGRRYFQVRMQADLPQLTRVKLSLYFVSGDPPTEELVAERIRRVSGTGHIEADLLGLKRPLWAGCYRLVAHVNPNRQVPSVLRELESLQKPVRRETNWYHGTPDQRKRQEQRAMEQARSDFRQFLLLSSQLKRFVMASASSSTYSVCAVHPFMIRVRLPQYWLIWSEQWKDRLRALQSSNRKRPRFEGRPVSFFFMESRTAYFLQTYLQGLQDLFEQSNVLMWSGDLNTDQVNTFRKSYRDLRDQVIRTMEMIGLTVPLSPKQQRQMKRLLKRFSSHLDNMLQFADGPASELNREKRARIRTHVNGLQSVLFRVDASVPDLLYRQVFDLSKHLQQLSGRLSAIEAGELQQSLQVVYQKYRHLQELTNSFLNESLETTGK